MARMFHSPLTARIYCDMILKRAFWVISNEQTTGVNESSKLLALIMNRKHTEPGITFVIKNFSNLIHFRTGI